MEAQSSTTLLKNMNLTKKMSFDSLSNWKSSVQEKSLDKLSRRIKSLKIIKTAHLSSSGEEAILDSGAKRIMENFKRSSSLDSLSLSFPKVQNPIEDGIMNIGLGLKRLKSLSELRLLFHRYY